MRKILTQNTSFYVDSTNGLDSNDGLTPQTPWEHIQYACNFMVSNIDFAGFSTIIQLADGIYVESVQAVGSVIGSVQFQILGNLNNPENVIWKSNAGTAAIESRDRACVTVRGVKFIANENGSRAFRASQFGILDFGNVEFGAYPGGVHVEAYQTGSINIIAPYKVSGSAILHLQLSGNSMICLGGQTVTFTSPVKFDSFVDVTYGSYLWAAETAHYVGSPVMAQKYRVHTNSIVNSYQTIFPGNLPGSVTLGGQYT